MQPFHMKRAFAIVIILVVFALGATLGGLLVRRFGKGPPMAGSTPMTHGDQGSPAMDNMAGMEKKAPKMENMPGMDMSSNSGQDMSNMPGMEKKSTPSPEDSSSQTMAPGAVMLSPAEQQLTGVRYAEVRKAHLQRTVRTVGAVQMDETKIAHVHVKVDGWIDKVFLDYVGKMVKKGQPLFTLYSPDLVSTEEEYLIALKGQKYLSNAPYSDVAAGADSLLRATRDRLRLWDITDDQIHNLETTGKAMRDLTMYSPLDGFVTARNAYEQTRVTPETDLYDIADLSTIWVNVDIYEYEAPYVHVAQAASMQLSYFPGKTYRGRVAYVYPTLDPQTRTIKVRLEFPNPGYELKPNMYADVELNVDYGVQTLVPSEAVLNSGTQQIVFLAKQNGYFEPREIKIGNQFDGQTVVLAGLRTGETIVASGNFLIDSESRLGTAMQGMAGMPGMSSSKK